MADISIRRPHSLGLDQIKTITQKVVTSVQAEFPSLVKDISWNGDQTQAKVKGKGFDGDFRVSNTEVAIDINLAMLARPFKGKVEKEIQSRLEQYLAG